MDLKQERASLIAQRDNALSVFNQAVGAISLIDALLAEAKEEGAPTEEELAKKDE